MASGQQINLDKGEGQILTGVIVDDIRVPCTQLNIKFECADKLEFSLDDQCYFTYKKYDWIPFVSNECLTNQNTWHYELLCYPKKAFELITTPAQNTQLLARAMGLQLSGNSSSLPLVCPVINYYSSLLIKEIRRQSFNQAYINKKIGDAYFIYFDTDTLYSLTWKQIVNQQANSLETRNFLQGQNIVTFQDNQMSNYATHAYGTKVWQEEDYISRMIGKKIIMRTADPAYFAQMYTMKFTDTSQGDQDVSFLCVRSEQHFTEGAGFINEFAAVNYIK